VLAMQEASDRMVGESVPVAEAATLAAVSIRTGPAPTMRDVLVRQLKCGIGGVAATWFSGMRANARPARRAGRSSVFHYFARRGPTKEAHRRALNQPDGLLRSVAGRGHARCLRVTPPRERPDQRKQSEAGDHRPSTPRGTHQGRGWGTHQGRDQGTPTGTHPGEARGPRNRCRASRSGRRNCIQQ